MSRAAPLPQRGVSLIEAICALGVMAFGMLAVVGVQATLRSNADVSKQRAEAVRIAQQGMERSRGFARLAADAATPTGAEFDELATGTDPAVIGTNATYTPSRAVPVPATALYPGMKTFTSSVIWTDRAGVEQRVQLNSVIAGVEPEVAASMALPQQSGVVLRPGARHRSIPLLAKDLGNGTSAIKPPGAPGTVAWRFNNVTGLITFCSVDPAVVTQTSDLTLANLVCGGQTALGLSGFVRYARTAVQPLEADAKSPTAGPGSALSVSITRTDGGLAAVCYTQSVATPVAYNVYSCAVPVTVTLADPNPVWSGSMSFTADAATPIATTLANTSANSIKVCSYATAGDNVGSAAFSGGDNSITLTPRTPGVFRAWAAGSRIDLQYGDWTYAYTVSALAAAPAAGVATQTVTVLGALPGAGVGLRALAFADRWPFSDVSVPLINSNYLVIRAGDGGVATPGTEVAFSCPVSTLAHQPAS
jgi:Tfp pilus assembly protein PilV